jgi:hypothetical protein
MWCNSFDEHYDTNDRACELLKCLKKDMEWSGCWGLPSPFSYVL